VKIDIVVIWLGRMGTSASEEHIMSIFTVEASQVMKVAGYLEFG
jgi:hypothetical protein